MRIGTTTLIVLSMLGAFAFATPTALSGLPEPVDGVKASYYEMRECGGHLDTACYECRGGYYEDPETGEKVCGQWQYCSYYWDHLGVERCVSLS